ncbi:hypothetical protein FHR70_003651 [Microvirga lupini]|uniref:Uncharacterized protein n=1 Tax=Microvirga lupini TaxID=420324 RepID=A0A7W4VPI0_9HYPH|nr:hypothetical protein [Microvirga lupini]
MRDGALRGGAACTGCRAVIDERLQAAFESAKLDQFPPNLGEMRLGEIAGLVAVAIRILGQGDEGSHLLDGESEIAAAANERQLPQVVFGIKTMSSRPTTGWRQQADLLVVPDSRDIASRLLGQGTDGQSS